MTSHQALRQWFEGFTACVRRRDFAGGRKFFDRRVVGYGSYARACEGLDALVSRQWMKIWPNITGFRFDLRALRYRVSRDGCLLCAMVPWRSTGYHKNGRPFTRNGRMTLLLTRPRRGRPWKASHTHYSLNPGIPQTAIRRRR